MENGLYTAHEVAVIIADLFGDTCACNFNGIDEWLPFKCELLDACPNPCGVACWEQYLKYRHCKNEMEANMDELKPCIKCGGKGVERIGYGLPYFVCGIPMGRTIGTIIQCSDCGHQTNAYSGDYTMAYKEWNEMEENAE